MKNEIITVHLSYTYPIVMFDHFPLKESNEHFKQTGIIHAHYLKNRNFPFSLDPKDFQIFQNKDNFVQVAYIHIFPQPEILGH